MPPDVEQVQRNYFSWMFSALGFNYAALLTIAGVVCFLLTLAVVIRGKGPMAAASLMLIVNVPLLIGIFAAIQGAIASYTVIAMSVTPPTPADVATGISTALAAPMVGMLLMIPAYLTAALGAFVRSLWFTGESSKASASTTR